MFVTEQCLHNFYTDKVRTDKTNSLFLIRVKIEKQISETLFAPKKVANRSSGGYLSADAFETANESGLPYREQIIFVSLKLRTREFFLALCIRYVTRSDFADSRSSRLGVVLDLKNPINKREMISYRAV
jgi:hypothetical protein